MGILRTLRRAIIDRPFWVDHEPHLRLVRGVIHVGANIGQERELYRRRGLQVLWIEPIPEVFATLKRNIAGLPGQRAIQALLTDRAGETHTLHVASNKGGSSSILPMKLHDQVWPEVRYEREITLRSETLPSLLRAHGIDVAGYDLLTLDTQGAELLVLRGAVPLLPNFRFLQVEVADFEAYAGGCQLPQLEAFLREQGFTEQARYRFATRPGIGSVYDIVYRRDGAPMRHSEESVISGKGH